MLAELRTGIIVTLDGTRRYTGEGKYFAECDSVESAESYAEARIEEQPEFEANVRDFEGYSLVVFRKGYPTWRGRSAPIER